MTWWRAAGLNYVSFSRICAQVVRRSLKPELREAAVVRNKPQLKVTRWKDGQPQTEYDTVYKTAIASSAYVATQTGKLLIIATFFPASDLPPTAIDYAGELLSSATLFADLIGMHVAITQTPGRGTVRWLTVAVGWSVANLACTKAFPLWQARGLEFDWRFLQLAGQANIELLVFVSLAALLWLRTRWPKMNAVTYLLILACLKQFALKAATHNFFPGSSGNYVVGDLIWTLVFALLTMRIYIVQSQQAAVAAGFPDGYDMLSR